MKTLRARSATPILIGVALASLLGSPMPAAGAPEGQVVSLQAVSIAHRWFDPAEAEGIITPFLFYYRIQQLMHDKAMFGPIWEPAILYGVGPRVAESALGLITNMAGSAPYEELRLKGR